MGFTEPVYMSTHGGNILSGHVYEHRFPYGLHTPICKNKRRFSKDSSPVWVSSQGEPTSYIQASARQHRMYHYQSDNIVGYNKVTFEQ